jgi:hypothetical protein
LKLPRRGGAWNRSVTLNWLRAVARQPRRPRHSLRTYPLLQDTEELLALVGAEDAFVLQEVLDNQLLHRLLLHADLVDFGLDGRSVQRVGLYRVNEANVQIDCSVPDAGRCCR